MTHFPPNYYNFEITGLSGKDRGKEIAVPYSVCVYSRANKHRARQSTDPARPCPGSGPSPAAQFRAQPAGAPLAAGQGGGDASPAAAGGAVAQLGRLSAHGNGGGPAEGMEKGFLGKLTGSSRSLRVSATLGGELDCSRNLRTAGWNSRGNKWEKNSLRERRKRKNPNLQQIETGYPFLDFLDVVGGCQINFMQQAVFLHLGLELRFLLAGRFKPNYLNKESAISTENIGRAQ
ncbi:copine-1 isoform X2 [Taeniopygia guttata]|uniref:copine-1 isoform X2 n=1 Tax=Taeniopygia guttata TaxID=59729 RepID=UPI003BB91543